MGLKAQFLIVTVDKLLMAATFALWAFAIGYGLATGAEFAGVL